MIMTATHSVSCLHCCQLFSNESQWRVNQNKRINGWYRQTPGVNNQQIVHTTICRMIFGALLSKHCLQTNRDSDSCSRVWAPIVWQRYQHQSWSLMTLVIDVSMKQMSLISDANHTEEKKTFSRNIFNTLLRVSNKSVDDDTHFTFDKDISRQNLYVISCKHQHIFSWNQQQSIKTR